MKSTGTKVLFFFVVFLMINEIGIAQTVDINQTLSDGAQRNTIAFSGLSFLSGNFCSSTFLPPGKVADYCGFQYFRDNEPGGFGHNTDFLTIVAFNVLEILDSDQIDQFVAMANNQVSKINDYAYKRFPLIDAFYRLHEGDVPPNSNGLNLDSVMTYSSELYNIDAQISYERAKTYGQVIQSLNQQQATAMDNLVTIGTVANFDSTLANPIAPLNLPHDIDVLVMTYASEIFSWYWGDVASDTYFAPERQADYFGSFYLKDAPAVGSPGYQIDTALTQVKGTKFLETILTTPQALQITSLVDTQRVDLDSIVSKRTQISTLLRGFLSGNTVDSLQVIALSEQYGALDGKLSYYYATAFSSVGNSLTQVQMDSLVALRDLDDFPYDSDSAYLYADIISTPTIPNTDFLFNITTSINESTFANDIDVRCFPNPFSEAVQIHLQLPEKDRVTIQVWDVSGNKIKTIAENQFRAAGSHQFLWNGDNHSGNSISSGIYLCTITTSQNIQTEYFVKFY